MLVRQRKEQRRIVDRKMRRESMLRRLCVSGEAHVSCGGRQRKATARLKSLAIIAIPRLSLQDRGLDSSLMFRRFSLRFSLLSLLLLMTLAAVAVSHWITNRALLLARAELELQRERIRELSH